MCGRCLSEARFDMDFAQPVAPRRRKKKPTKTETTAAAAAATAAAAVREEVRGRLEEVLEEVQRRREREEVHGCVEEVVNQIERAHAERERERERLARTQRAHAEWQSTLSHTLTHTEMHAPHSALSQRSSVGVVVAHALRRCVAPLLISLSPHALITVTQHTLLALTHDELHVP